MIITFHCLCYCQSDYLIVALIPVVFQLVMAEEEYFQNILLILNTRVRDNMNRLRKSVNKEGLVLRRR